MVDLGPIGSWNPGAGPVVTWIASAAAREGAAAAPADELPAGFLVVSWDVTGVCDIAAMTRAINTHVRRAFDRRTPVDPDSVEFIPALAGLMGPEQIREHVLTTTPGTPDWDCFTFGVIQKSDHFTVYAGIDHLRSDLIFPDIQLTYAGLTGGRPVELPPVNGYRGHHARRRANTASMTLESKDIQGWIESAGITGDWIDAVAGHANSVALIA